MNELRRKEGLGIIFAFFLGLMVTAFVGVGVYTFYPPPERESELLNELIDQMDEIRGSRAVSELTEAEKERYDTLSEQRSELYAAYYKAQQAWLRNSSILLVMLATVIMAISLISAEKLSLISNGLLLGGVFTMLYGVGWSLVAESTIGRFIVIAIGLAITIALGYIRFVRKQRAPVVQYAGQPSGNADLAHLEQRVGALEKRINEAAAVLSSNNQ
ncbi:MAG TPA: hypothetical protein GXZ82_03800 [Firmicutes bacterium]|jgi:hypothetical protein|nr:hypothetical protein [Bacillota bacterium]